MENHKFSDAYPQKGLDITKPFLVYNRVMAYVNVVVDAFWEIMEAFVPVAVPIIVIILIFSFVKGLIFNDR